MVWSMIANIAGMLGCLLSFYLFFDKLIARRPRIKLSNAKITFITFTGYVAAAISLDVVNASSRSLPIFDVHLMVEKDALLPCVQSPQMLSATHAQGGEVTKPCLHTPFMGADASIFVMLFILRLMWLQ